MSTSPEIGARADDRIVTLISRWLARHVSDEELKRGLEEEAPGELEPAQAEALGELLEELAGARGGASRGEAERVARETLEAIALGG
jgi:hypothetical protein